MPKGWAPAKSGAIYFRPTNAEDRAIVKALAPLSLKLGNRRGRSHRSDLWRRCSQLGREDAGAKPGTVAELVERAKRSYLPRIQNLETRAWRATARRGAGAPFRLEAVREERPRCHQGGSGDVPDVDGRPAPP
jgi:hypothetical protein